MKKIVYSLGGVLLLGMFSALLINYFLSGHVWTEGGFATSVLNNWYDYGYFALKGQVVPDAGGISHLESVVPYTGYRAFSLVPVHLLHLMTGDLVAALRLFLIVLTVIVAVSIWAFLGRTPLALAAAAAFCFSPGYIAIAAGGDLMHGPVLLGIPVLTWFLIAMESDKRGKALTCGLLALVAGYVQIEWSTGFAVFILWAAVVAIWWRTNRRRVVYLTVFLVVALLLCLPGLVLEKARAPGVLEKITPGDKTHSGFLQDLVRYLGSMTVGSVGYDGMAMSWGLGLRRLASVNLVGLLPLWIMLAWIIRRSPSKRGWVKVRNLAPLLAAAFPVLVLRNFMTPHKWMQMAIISTGILFSMHLFLRATDPTPENQELKPSLPVCPRKPALWGFALGSFLYCFFVLAVLRSNDAEKRAFLVVVSQNTPRSALIVIGPNLGSCVADLGLGTSAATMIDRGTVQAQEPVPRIMEEGSFSGAYFLDSEPVAELGVPLATSEAARTAWLEELLGWYRHHIAGWTEKSRPKLPSKYYLYRITAPHRLSDSAQ